MKPLLSLIKWGLTDRNRITCAPFGIRLLLICVKLYISLATSLDWCIFVFLSFSLESLENLMIDNFNCIPSLVFSIFGSVLKLATDYLPLDVFLLPSTTLPYHYPIFSFCSPVYFFTHRLCESCYFLQFAQPRPHLLFFVWTTVVVLGGRGRWASARPSVSVRSRLCAIDGSEPAGVMWRDAAPRRIAQLGTYGITAALPGDKWVTASC